MMQTSVPATGSGPLVYDEAVFVVATVFWGIVAFLAVLVIAL